MFIGSRLKKNYSFFLLCFFAINAVINLIALYHDLLLLEWLTKPLIIIFLTGFYLQKKERNSAYLFILFISWIGNFLFMLKSPTYTIAGLICFWGTLLLFSHLTITDLNESLEKKLKKRNTFVPLIIFTTYVVGIMWVLGPYLSDYYFIIFAYAITLAFLGFIVSLLLMENLKNIFRLSFLLGILILFVDASIICYQLFVEDSIIISVTVRGLYILAQLLICLYFTYEHNLKTLQND